MTWWAWCPVKSGLSSIRFWRKQVGACRIIMRSSVRGERANVSAAGKQESLHFLWAPNNPTLCMSHLLVKRRNIGRSIVFPHKLYSVLVDTCVWSVSLCFALTRPESWSFEVIAGVTLTMVLTTSYLARRIGYNGYSSWHAMMVWSYPISVILHTHIKKKSFSLLLEVLQTLDNNFTDICTVVWGENDFFWQQGRLAGALLMPPWVRSYVKLSYPILAKANQVLVLGSC